MAASDTDHAVLQHLAYSVFLPPKLPQEEQEGDFQRSVDLAIINSVIQAGQEYSVGARRGTQWSPIVQMLRCFDKSVENPVEKDELCEDVQNMRPGDFISLYLQAQNTGLFIRKHPKHTTFEVFEAQAQSHDVMSISGKIIRHFPGSAIQVPDLIAKDRDFIEEVANILAQLNTEIFDEAHPKTRKVGIEVRESRDSVNPGYFIQYFLGFLRGMGTPVEPTRIIKCLADEVLWMGAENPWRCSPIWLIVRVALQTSFGSIINYKHFMVYYHSSILSQCCKHRLFSSDLLHAMCVKMARRLYKVKDGAPQFVIKAALTTTKGTQDLLQARWDSIQFAQAHPPSEKLDALDFETTIHQTLPNSQNYLKQVFEGRSGQSNPSTFTPNHSSRLEGVLEFSCYADGALSQHFSSDPHLALFDFEASVFDKISIWVSKQWNYPGACSTIYSCFQQYSAAAKSYYTRDIADQSIMILTLLRLWMAIDELATRVCPLLSEFSPELPNNILDPLLLHTSQHIEQARIIQKYICKRHAKVSPKNTSIFLDDATDSSFAVQYFRASTRHHNLKVNIERHALEEKQQKIQVLEGMNARCKKLVEEIQGSVHQFYETAYQTRRHSQFCVRCHKESERRDLQIQPHEWPLPSDQLEAETVVFELDRPESFTIWQDITCQILVDLGTTSARDKCEQYAVIKGYSPLARWIPSSKVAPRIIFASSTKSFRYSHYNNIIRLPASEHQVCLDNGLWFMLYDKSGETWASGPFPDAMLAKYGTLKLPSGGPYRHLEYTIGGTTHTSNRVLADQHNCPKELSLHEHIAFGTLRSGARLQWMNMVRGLEESLLTFSKDEVQLLHTQAAWQIGPLSPNGSRIWHEELVSQEFAGTQTSRVQEVHLNVLTGQILIDAKPLGRLPWRYLRHLTYICLFGQTIFDVVPAEYPGMRFTAWDLIHGHQVSLAFRNSDKQLIIQARKNGQLYKLIPHQKLSKDLPYFFSRDYHHWADIGNKTVEFHPISSPWSNDCRWILWCDKSRATTFGNQTDNLIFVNIHSVPFQSLARLISPLESNQYLHVTRSVNGQIKVELPRMKLLFFINEENRFESQNFRGHILDENQSAGTLFRLKNQLVLRVKQNNAQPCSPSLSVLIPDGKIEFVTCGFHVSVSITFDRHRDVDVYWYKVDSDLNHLAADTGLTSRLLKIYLHALTSHCLPDPLTGRTGTEEALQELSQASTLSFEQIDLRQAELLKAIGLLSPRRKYYPEHLQCMQTTDWLDLPPLSQHFALSFAAAAIIHCTDVLQIFSPLNFSLGEYKSVHQNPDTLLKRAAQETTLYYPLDTSSYVSGVPELPIASDYAGLGCNTLTGEWVEAGQVASWALGLVHQNWGNPVFKSHDLVSLAESWSILDDSEKHQSLAYTPSWFSLSLRSSWINVFNLLRRAHFSSNKYILASFLASLAFSQSLPKDLIPVFLAFATNPLFRSLDPPPKRSYCFGDEYEPTRIRIHELVSGAAHPVSSTPAGKLVQNKDESFHEFGHRKESYHNAQLAKCQAQLVDSLAAQWYCVCETPSMQLQCSRPSHSNWINVQSCLKLTTKYFLSCVNNIDIRNHPQKVEAVLSSRPTTTGTNFTPVDQKPVLPSMVPQVPCDPWNFRDITSLMNSRPAPDLSDIYLLTRPFVSRRVGPAIEKSRLESLLSEVQSSPRHLNSRYGLALDKSCKELDIKPTILLPQQFSPGTMVILKQSQENCMDSLSNTFQKLSSALSPQTDTERIVAIAGIWPQNTP